MQVLESAIDRFAQLHAGKLPSALVVTPAALVALGAAPGFRASAVRGVPVQVTEFEGADAVAPGSGSRLGVFVNDTGVQLHVAAVDLR